MVGPVMEFQIQESNTERGFIDSLYIMALPVMEFQCKGYKIRKIFAKKSTYPKEIIENKNWTNGEPQ